MPITFTARELSIIRLVASGLRNRAIAGRLNLCEGTVKNSMREIYDKSGMDTRVELTLWWLAHRSEYSAIDSHVQMEEVNPSEALGGPR